jgi:hypothetical protein
VKNILTFSFILLLALSTFSQRTPEAFIAGIPVPPGDACTISKDTRENFSSKIEALQEQLTEEIKTRKEFCWEQQRKDSAKYGRTNGIIG